MSKFLKEISVAEIDEATKMGGKKNSSLCNFYKSEWALEDVLCAAHGGGIFNSDCSRAKSLKSYIDKYC